MEERACRPLQTMSSSLGSGDVVTREELRKQIWPEDTFVDFDNSVADGAVIVLGIVQSNAR
jgi:DNA-binding winged helix-turn-helix (wHTH) protein